MYYTDKDRLKIKMKFNQKLIEAALSIIETAGCDYKGDYANECLLYARIANDSQNIGYGAGRLLEAISVIKKVKRKN